MGLPPLEAVFQGDSDLVDSVSRARGEKSYEVLDEILHPVVMVLEPSARIRVRKASSC